MAKDAKGHGSERGGGVTADNDVQRAARFQAGLGSYRRDGTAIPGYGGVSAGDQAAASALANGHPKSGAVPVHSGASGPSYNREAVNKAIASSNRAGRRIGGKEARMIHALLKGRS